jgi:hypothetical protein
VAWRKREDDLLRLQLRDGAQQRTDQRGSRQPAVLVIGDAYFERRSGDAGDRQLQGVEWDVMEDDPVEACPEALPPARENAGACRGGGAGKAREDQEEQVVWEGADKILSAVTVAAD